MKDRKFISYPKIGQYREVIRDVVNHARYAGKDENNEPIYVPDAPLPTLEFRGTVKLHGTNAGVVMNKHGEMWAQSRSRCISIENDNAGFAFFVESNKEIFEKLFKTLDMKNADYIAIFGEWCGDNIQTGVVLNKLPKTFVIFDVKLAYKDTEENMSEYLYECDWEHLKSHEHRIYNILEFSNWKKEIDFYRPELMQEEFIKITEAVENECPVGKAFLDEFLTDNVAYEENGKIWFAKESGFSNILIPKLKELFSELRKKNPTGINYIKFNR